MSEISKSRSAVRKLAKLSMLAAVSIVLVTLIRIPAPAPVSFLIYDPADIPILVAAFAYGPLEGIAITLVVSFLQSLLINADMPYGFIMHTIATGALVAAASLIYRRFHSKKGALIALAAGTAAMTLAMIPANLLITPLFFGSERSVVVAILPYIVLFNLVKAGLNCLVTFALYKRIRRFFKKS